MSKLQLQLLTTAAVASLMFMSSMMQTLLAGTGGGGTPVKLVQVQEVPPHLFDEPVVVRTAVEEGLEPEVEPQPDVAAVAAPSAPAVNVAVPKKPRVDPWLSINPPWKEEPYLPDDPAILLSIIVP
jgi:hypothetical protein